jgi:two-component system, OmpR family, response regulator
VRLLIVEDDPEMGELIQRGLAAEGYEIDLVSDGVQALMALTNKQSNVEYSMAAIDVMLPGMTGFEVCRRIRETGATLPLLLLTARDAVEDRVFGLDAGADDYLTKPFAFTELSARIRALLRREIASERLTLTIGNLRIDSRSGTASVASKALPMSPKEFTFLRLLAEQIDHPVSRIEILDQVWNTTDNIDPNIVDQYVSYLRRKLDSSGATVQITTVRGIGYRLEVAA